MFEQVDPLPDTKRGTPVHYWNRKAGLREGSTNMRGHIIWTLGVVPLARVPLRS